MKRVSAFFCALIMLFAFVVTAFSADIDGIDNGTEWDGATVYKLLDGESNCGVNFGAVKVKFDLENSAVFLCFMIVDPELETGNAHVGISLQIENSLPFEITMSSSPNYYDVSKYSFEGAMSVDENNGAICEIRLGVKEGLPKELDGSVRFIDANGEPSNYYYFTLVNEQYVETTAVQIAPTRDNDDPAYNPDLLTSKAKTTKKSTTKKSRTTTKKTTSSKTTTRKSINGTPYSYTGRTEKITERKTEAQTEKIVDTPAGITVYYYEKEVIISQVPVTQAAETSEQIVYATAVHTATTAPNTEIRAQKTVSLSKGSKYKIIASVIGSIAFAAVAVFGVTGVKRKRGFGENNENGSDE